MSKHAPGPWTAIYHAGFGVLIVSHEGRVARVTSGGDPDYERIDANAYLIAAAPDMLAALNMALDAIKDNWEIDDDVQTAIRAAIAKAEGEE